MVTGRWICDRSLEGKNYKFNLFLLFLFGQLLSRNANAKQINCNTDFGPLQRGAKEFWALEGLRANTNNPDSNHNVSKQSCCWQSIAPIGGGSSQLDLYRLFPTTRFDGHIGDMICLSELLLFSAKNQQKPHLNSPSKPCLTSSNSHWIPSLKTNSSGSQAPKGNSSKPTLVFQVRTVSCRKGMPEYLATHMFFKGMLTCWGNSSCKGGWRNYQWDQLLP